MPPTPRPPSAQVPGTTSSDATPDAITSSDASDALVDGTPVLAAGTRDDVADKARLAREQADARADGRSEQRTTGRADDIASLAHDLKNPLTIIMLEASQIEARLATRAEPAVVRGLERIAQNAAYIDRLVSDLLDVSAADAGKLDLRFERVDLARLLREAIARAVPTPDRHRVRLELRELVSAFGDQVRIERVVSNLLGNALKYTPAGGLVTVRLDRRGVRACVSVIDNGPGLTAEEARHVFERFRRANRGRQPGYGLGLYTARKIIDAHGGRIGVASTPGQGSRFYFELPLVQPSSEQ